MREDAELAAIRAYYDRGEEWERLTQSHGQLEFERTKEIVLRHLPPPPYTHRTGQLRAGLAAAGLRVIDLVSLEGPAFLLDDLSGRFADAQARQVVLETARALERVPELLGIGPHLLATAAASG